MKRMGRKCKSGKKLNKSECLLMYTKYICGKNRNVAYSLEKAETAMQEDFVLADKYTGKTEGSLDDFLKGKVLFWRFSRLLKELYQGEEPLARRLARKLTEYNSDEDGERTARRVRNWMHDRNLPKNREEVFKICFALELDEQRAETLLGITVERGIHYRNPREVIYAYCLRSKEDYPEAVRKTREIDVSVEKEMMSACTYKETETTAEITGYIRSRFEHVRSEAELKEFLEMHRRKFGSQNRTAYRKFRKMLNYLLHPSPEDDFLPDEQEYSIRKVVDQYLRMGVPYEKKSGRYTQLQREIKQHWPSAKTIYEMCSGKLDVDRKTLLLLYLATEGEGDPDAADTRSISEHRRRMDLMLAECGMPVLNVHCPFDYLILLAVDQNGEEDFIGYRMERMLRKIFDADKPATYLLEK